MVVETKNNKKNSVKLEASLAPAEAEVGAVAKADQKLEASLAPAEAEVGAVAKADQKLSHIGICHLAECQINKCIYNMH